MYFGRSLFEVSFSSILMISIMTYPLHAENGVQSPSDT